MMVRMKFYKTGPLKFIGHLDIMRYFQKAIRRAGIDVEYSKGFSPHQIMSFAAPLGVGLTSEGEYLDVSLQSTLEKETMLTMINEAMNEYIQVTDFRYLPEDSKNAMSIVAGADYKVSLKDGYEFISKEKFIQKFNEFMAQEEIVVTKKSKKSENEVDIKPLIYNYAFDREIFFEDSNINKEINNKEEIAEIYSNGIYCYLRLAAGSVNNLKPELILEGFCKYIGVEISEFAFQMHRIDVYALSQETNQLTSLLLI